LSRSIYLIGGCGKVWRLQGLTGGGVYAMERNSCLTTTRGTDNRCALKHEQPASSEKYFRYQLECMTIEDTLYIPPKNAVLHLRFIRREHRFSSCIFAGVPPYGKKYVPLPIDWQLDLT
jgi:hypothetical protein